MCRRGIFYASWRLLESFVFFRFFFFQAEDGIRDDLVTGVQTCALPISGGHTERRSRPVRRGVPHGARRARSQAGPCLRAGAGGSARRRRGMVRHREPHQIGRASCRERVEDWGGAGTIKKKELNNEQKNR